MPTTEERNFVFAMLTYQDSLMQSYRGFHFTFQSIVVAIAAAVSVTAFGTTDLSIYLFSSGILMAMYLASRFFGRIANEIIQSNGEDVTFFQELLKEYEEIISGKTKENVDDISDQIASNASQDRVVDGTLGSIRDYPGSLRILADNSSSAYRLWLNVRSKIWQTRDARNKFRQFTTIWTGWIWTVLFIVTAVRGLALVLIYQVHLAWLVELAAHIIFAFLAGLLCCVIRYWFFIMITEKLPDKFLFSCQNWPDNRLELAWSAFARSVSKKSKRVSNELRYIVLPYVYNWMKLWSGEKGI
jgi:hypothetical protein